MLWVAVSHLDFHGNYSFAAPLEISRSEITLREVAGVSSGGSEYFLVWRYEGLVLKHWPDNTPVGCAESVAQPVTPLKVAASP